MAHKKPPSLGTAFESEIEKICATYEAYGIAKIKRVSPPTRIVGGGSFRRVIQLPNPFLDFVGTMHDGRSIMIECKATDDERLCIRDNDDGCGIKATQLIEARRWQEMNCCVVFLWRRLGITRIMTPSMIESVALERKSIRWESVHAIPEGERVPVDFVTAARALYQLPTSTQTTA